MVTCIRNCAWAICWSEAQNRHFYENGVDLVFSGDTITYVGSDYTGPVDVEIDGRQIMAMPGLVNVHTHPSMEPSYKGIREEHGIAEHYMSGLYERCAVFMPDEDGQRAGAELAYSELLLSGVTSVADLSIAYNGWRELAEKSGLRVWMAPLFASANWYVDNRHEVKFRWDEAGGWRGLERAVKLIDDIETSERLTGMFYPAQIDTCSAELLRAAKDAADTRGLVMTTHIAQSVMEFNIMVQRYGKTPIQWANDIGILGANCLLGHAIFIDEHSWLHWHTRRDLEVLSETGAVVAHCPNVFSRYGQTLEDFGKYRRAGVKIGIGTDTNPHNMIEEMRCAAIFARIAAEDIFTTTTEDVFNAATIGGATALGRQDLGRLAPKCKADIVLLDLKHPAMRPVRDPMRSLVYTASDRAVLDVYVDGRQVVANRQVLTLDVNDACERLEAAQRRMIAEVPSLDYAGRNVDEIAPMSFTRNLSPTF